MRLTVIGFAGMARSGKDTAAEAIAYKRFALADKLKAAVCDLFGWNIDVHGNGCLKDIIDPEWGFSPRKAMQLFGTEFGRGLDESLWVKMAEKELLRTGGWWKITDVRFENEAELVRKYGTLIHIKRDCIKRVGAHSSESGLSIHRKDYVIQNNGTIEDLHKAVKAVVYGR